MIFIRSVHNGNIHCVKSVQIRSYFWYIFSRIWTEYGEILVSLRIQSECGKNGPEITPYFGTFHAAMRIERHNMILLHCRKLIELVCLTFRMFSNIFEDESAILSLFLSETNFHIIKYKIKEQ